MAEIVIVTPLGPIRNAEDFMGFIDQINENPDLLATLPPEDARMYTAFNEMQAEYNQLRAALYLPLEADQETREAGISLIMTARRELIRRLEALEDQEEEEEEQIWEPVLEVEEEEEEDGNENDDVVQNQGQEPRQGQQG